jgi:hypothetical protein
MQNFTTQELQDSIPFSFIAPYSPYALGQFPFGSVLASVRATMFRKRERDKEVRSAQCRGNKSNYARNYASPYLFNPIRSLIHTSHDIIADLSALYYANNRR